MVLNNKGGKNGKKMSRKHVNAENQRNEQKKARMPSEEGEFIACATKLLGNGMVLIVDLTKKEYICIIRKKFKGRGKGRNMIQKGTWLMAGKRTYEKQAVSGKLLKCDLLEVYNEKEKQILRKQCPEYKWSMFDAYADVAEVATGTDDYVIEFVNNQNDYRTMIDTISDDDSDDDDSDGENGNVRCDEFGNTIKNNSDSDNDDTVDADTI